MIEDKIRQKIESLIERSLPLAETKTRNQYTPYAAKCSSWVTEAVNVTELAIPSPKNAYRAGIEKAAVYSDVTYSVATIADIFRALLPDIDAGLLGDLGNKIRAETFDDFLDHAEHYLKEDRQTVAGVIAGVAFEDTIRRIFCDKIADDREDKVRNLEQMINALASKSIITGMQTKQAKVAADLRNKATHALWEEVNLEGIEATIKITKLFLREHLGG